jgi:hypothetical protein
MSCTLAPVVGDPENPVGASIARAEAIRRVSSENRKETTSTDAALRMHQAHFQGSGIVGGGRGWYRMSKGLFDAKHPATRLGDDQPGFLDSQLRLGPRSVAPGRRGI